jgi:hypothetical protein
MKGIIKSETIIRGLGGKRIIRSETIICGLGGKRIGMKGGIINRDKKTEEEEAESQHLDLGGMKEGREVEADLGWRSKVISQSSTLSRVDLEEEASPTRLGRRIPGSWTILKYTRSRNPQSLGNITLWL